MSYKLVALDLDDTLLDKKQKLSPRTVKVVHKVEDRGIKVIIATGRMLVSALPYIKKLGLTGPMITYNGAYVKDPFLDKLVYHQPIPLPLARKIINKAQEENLHINLYQDDTLFVEHRNEETEIYEKIAGVKAREVGSLSRFIQKGATKLLIVEKDRERHDYYLEEFTREFTPAVTITKSKDYFIEFMAGGVSKGKALQVVTEKMGIDRADVVAIGDSWNDLEMLRWSGLGVAMDGAPSAVKDVADEIAPPHDQEGVAVILESLFLS